MTQIIKPTLSFKNVEDGGKSDADSFALAKRYGYDAYVRIAAIIDPTNISEDGIEIIIEEQDGRCRKLSIFIPQDADLPVEVGESMISRIPITHNENENENESNTTK